MLITAPATFAQTVGYADAIKILAASCGKDIESYCKSATLANNGITQCLEKNQSKLSAKCNADRLVVISLIQARLAAQAEAPKLCQRDAAQYCKGVKAGAGHVLRCLLKAQPSVSEKCNTAIDLAGYR
ncbi:cysteine rich repeat domain protein, putative [Stappia aggregata IAM 12614]|uniref:Cysteine rich repeat domain protein, putative n=2 Tax=Roseibium aggregatum TaxID=187304 RepID=A0NXE3_ROSAI|nr:cysteine rich repeat domain protein, putative [Stappia aggregata IAM 12614] [Roseibium aggregatum IAM 12614]